MAEDLQAAIYGGSWWMPPRTAFYRSSCSSVTADMESFEPFCPRGLMDIKTKLNDKPSHGSIIFQDSQKPGGRGTTTILPGSASFQMMATMDWIQNLLLVQEAEDKGLFMTMDQHQSLNFYPSSLLQSLSNTNSTSPLDCNISSFYPSESPQFILSASYREQESCQKLATKPNKDKKHPDLGSAEDKSFGELPFKRPRLETPSPLPSFKVRKEKLGDRITALQQLVSPFGKTDTASVLHEAIDYINLLHDQINILSEPYMKKGATKQLQQIHDKVRESGHEIDLRRLGLFLVPVLSIFPATNEMAAGFLAPSYN